MSLIISIGSFVYITVLLFPVLAGADTYLSDGSLPISISMPAFFLLIATFIPILLKNLIGNGGRELARIYYNTMLITLPFFVVAIISLIWGLHPGTNWGEGGKLLFLSFYHWVLLMFSVGIAYSETMRKYHRLILIIILAGSCVAVWVDYFAPGTFSTLETRPSGFLGNPNGGGLSINCLTVASVKWRKGDLLNLLIFSLAGATVFATLSMSGLLLFSCVFGYYCTLNLREKRGSINKKMALMIITPLLILFLIKPLWLEMTGSGDTFSNSTSQKKIDSISKFFQGDFEFATEHSRARLAKEYWVLVFEAPIVGQGTAFTFSNSIGNSPHNMYLKQWVENGLLGFLAYLVLLGYAFRHFMVLNDPRGMIFIFLLTGAGFFDDHVLIAPNLVALLGILGALAFLEKPKPPSLDTPGMKLNLQGSHSLTA